MTTLDPYRRHPWAVDSDTATFRKSSIEPSFDASPLSFGGQPSRVKRITLAMTGSLRQLLGHCSRVCGVQLKADRFDGADCVNICIVFLLIKVGIRSHWKAAESISITMVACFPYSMVYWYWLSVRAHRASLFAARAGVAFVGPNNTMSGLWSVTRMNGRP